MAFISVIVPVYNSEKYLKNCIESVLNQTYRDFELLLINDGSEDGSPQICDEYASIDNRIKVFHKINEGSSTTRRFGIELSTGYYIFFIDSDDYLNPTAFEELVNVAVVRQADIVLGNLTIIRGNRKSDLKQHLPIDADRKQLISALLTSAVLGTLCGRLIKRELFHDIVMLDQLILGEDSVIIFQLFNKTERVILIENCIYNYVQHPESKMHVSSLKSLKSRIQYCNWVIKFLEGNSLAVSDDLVGHQLSEFMINHYFYFLLNGGYHNVDKEFSENFYNKYYKDSVAKKKFPNWKFLLLYLNRHNPLVGNLYRSLIVHSIVLLNKHVR